MPVLVHNLVRNTKGDFCCPNFPATSATLRYITFYAFDAHWNFLDCRNKEKHKHSYIAQRNVNIP